ncbi:MAG: PEP/pyruvate-binding domain-containing protein [Alphaproteobacteria bacterium]
MQPDAIQVIEQGGPPPANGALMSVGGKAFNLLKLAAIGFPVPPGFVLPTSMCSRWIAGEAPSPDAFRTLISGAVERLERASGLGFGDPRKPLLVSVRSGAPASMPGMLDTVLNVGLTHATLPGLIALTGNPRLAWDCYLRLIECYAETVQGLALAPFSEAAAKALAAAGADSLAELDTLSLRGLVSRHLEIFEDAAGEAFPDDPYKQLRHAVDAVFRSWDSERAKTYRRINKLEGLPGTAVTVQRMVYGNAGPRSGAGVGFTRNPATGEKRLYLDFAFDAQGEDVVAGRRPLAPPAELARLLPEVSGSLTLASARLERAFCDAQDFEFTVEEGQLFLLQTRDAKRSAWACLKIAVDMAREGVIAPDEALRRLKGLDLSTIVRRRVTGVHGDAIARGMAAGIGVATGIVALSVAQARASAAQGCKVILVRGGITTDDIDGIALAGGVLTAHGGRTSHAAVVARELGKVAIVGCRDLQISGDEASCMIGGKHFVNGDEITLDGETGRIYAGAVEVSEERPQDELAQVAAWSSGAGSAADAPISVIEAKDHPAESS